MKTRISILFMGILLLLNLILVAQSNPIVIEAESGTLGSDYTTGIDGDITYVEPQTNFASTSNPGNDTKVITLSVTFTQAGTYELYIKLRVGSATYDDDSFYLGNGFGTKSSTTDVDWIMVNMLAAAGYTVLTDVVNESGGAGSEVWKWVNLSVFTGGNTFTVAEGELTQTLQIGAREDGLRIDKLIFAKEGLYYTVNNLNNGEPGTTYHPDEGPLGPPLAEGWDKYLGCGYGPDSENKFADLWNQITPGNYGKWGWVEGTRDVMSWNDLDEAYNLAIDSGFRYRHHVLVWGNQQPHWLGALDTAEQREEIEEWFAAVAERYDPLDMIEVVNEPLHDPPDDRSDPDDGGYYEALGGPGETGWDWVLESFRLARQYFPNTELVINDYGIISSAVTTNDYLEIIKLLQEEDLIDGIGFQAHGFSLYGSTAVMSANLDSLAATGLNIYVTEMDVDGVNSITQLREYMRIFPLFWEHPSVKGITFWGYTPAMWRGGEQMAYLVTNEGVDRPAMTWLKAYMSNSFVPQEDLTISAVGGSTSINTDNGTLQLEVSILPDTATLQIVRWTVSDRRIATIDGNGLLTAIDDGTVTVIASAPEYNSDVSDTIEIIIANQLSDNAYLASISLTEGALVPDFDEDEVNYTVELPEGSDPPTVSAESEDDNADVNIVQATDIPGTATITVTAEDLSDKVYTIEFTEIIETGDNINNLVNNKIKIYPNPTTTGLFNIRGIDNISSITIFNIVGNEIQSINNLNQSSIEIKLDALPGIYLLQLSKGNEMVYRKILVK